MKKRIAVLLLAAAMCFISACGSSGASAKTEYEIWGAPNTLKVLADAHVYGEYKSGKAIDLTVARGEYESAQLIIEAKTDIKKFDAATYDLSGGGNTFAKENISVYAEKYILVDTVNEQNGALIGYYPDCLVPMANLAAAGENTVAKNRNQGLYVTFNIPYDTVPAVYTGKIEIFIDGITETVPVTLDVSALTVSKTVRTKSIFLNQFDYYKGELDSTLSMYKKYNDALIDFRLAPDVLYDRQFATEEGYALYAELAYEYATNERCSNYTIPYEKASGQENIDAAVFKNYLRALAEKSFETETDILKKAVFYCRLIDEPSLKKEAGDAVPDVCNTFRAAVESFAQEIEAGYPNVDADLKKSVAQSVRNIKNVVTSEMTEKFEKYIDCWCPTVDLYNTEADRAKYETQDERWWYTCSVPKTPFPTYHIEDSLLSARIMSWMQADYEVTGNLYWATNFSSEFIENDSSAVWLEDYYQTADRYKGANGDGFLFYPGKKYGVDGPLASMRLHAIRDGLEEYELIYDLKEKYKETAAAVGMDFTADSVLDSIAANLYDGTSVLTTDAKMKKAREQLFELAEMADSDAGVCIVSFNESGGKVKYEVAAASGYALYESGAECTDYTENNGYRLYKIEKTLSEVKNELKLSVKVGDKTYGYNVNLGGKYTAFGANEIAEWIEAETVATESGVTVTFNDGDVGGNVRVTGDMSGNFGKNASRMIVKLTNPNDGEIVFYIGIKYRDALRKQKLVSDITVAAGETVTVDIRNIYGFSWNLYGGTEYFELGVNGTDSNALTINSVEFYME